MKPRTHKTVDVRVLNDGVQTSLGELKKGAIRELPEAEAERLMVSGFVRVLRGRYETKGGRR